jgi:putative intracellular protease/amidase
MTGQPAFLHPIPYLELDTSLFDALVLPGGDGPGMRQYLESDVLRSKVLEFWQQNKLVGAICHGILVAARTVDPRTGRSILYGRKLTALPRRLDMAAYKLDSWLTRQGYIMYPKCVEDEVRDCLAEAEDFSVGRNPLSPHIVTDGNLVTARWYGEAEEFALQFADALEQRLRVKDAQ